MSVMRYEEKMMYYTQTTFIFSHSHCALLDSIIVAKDPA